MQDAPVIRGRHVSVKAVIALALSTVFSVVPLIPSAAAVIVGTSARREIARDRTLTGAGVAVAGVILGIVGVLLWLAVILAAVFFIDVARSLSGG
ncbi:MAG: DUF4190 domain-containing protein [Gaiellales bacterium]